MPADVGAVAQHPEVNGLVQEAIDRADSRYAQVEQIKRFTVLNDHLKQETGELTPTFKAKRNIVYERYADVFDELYALTRAARIRTGSGRFELLAADETYGSR